EDGIRDRNVTGVQTCALPILSRRRPASPRSATIRRSVEVDDGKSAGPASSHGSIAVFERPDAPASTERPGMLRQGRTNTKPGQSDRDRCPDDTGHDCARSALYSTI